MESNSFTSASTDNWRAPYGGDVGSTFVPGEQEQSNKPWSKPYGDGIVTTVPPTQPAVLDFNTGNWSGNGNNSSEIDPLTGQPLPRKGGTISPDAAPQMPGAGQTAGDVQEKAQMQQYRNLVDNALQPHTEGIGGNLLFGGVGGIVGAHTVPWLMNKYIGGNYVPPNVEPTTFRERVTKFWQDNHDPKTFYGTDVQFLNSELNGPKGLKAQIAGFNQPVQAGLNWRNARNTFFEKIDDAVKAGDSVERAAAARAALAANEHAINGPLAETGAKGKALFSSTEVKYLNDMVTPGPATMAPGLKDAIERNKGIISSLEKRGVAFSTVSDFNLTVDERVSKIRSILMDHDASVKMGHGGFLKDAEYRTLNTSANSMEAMMAAKSTAAKAPVKGLFSSYGLPFLKGVGVAGSLMVVDHYADQLLFGKNHGNGIGDSINSALVPAAMLIGPKTSFKTMGLVGIGALLAGKTVGAALGEGEHPTYTRLFSQSTPESFVLAAEALLPMKAAQTGLGKVMNWRQAALIGGTWLGFRALNLLNTQESQAEVKDRAWSMLTEDSKERGAGSMNAAIDKFSSLAASDVSSGLMSWTNVFKESGGKVKGARGESALQVYRTEWLTKPTSEFPSMLEAHRGAAILCTAFAEARLANGTHVPTITDTPTYLLEGLNLDMGAKAARDFIIARNSINSAKQFVQDNLGKEIAGKTVEQSEIADLDAVKQRIEANEAVIYGKHDLTKAVRDLAKWGEGLNAPHMMHLVKGIRDTIAANKDSADTRYNAKLYRYLATIYLSIAYAKQDGDPQSASQMLGGDTYSGRQALDMTGQQFGYDGALDCIARAIQLDGNNPDLPELYQIAQEINAKLPGNIRKQMEDGRYNPNQIRQ